MNTGQRSLIILPVCSQTDFQMKYEMRASTWNLNFRVLPLLGSPAQKETGSALAGFLSFVIMFYTQGNFNV